MAFAAMEVTCALTAGGAQGVQPLPVLGRQLWSQSFASGGTTALAAALPQQAFAPTAQTVTSYLIFRVYATADSYISIGPNPNAAASPRTMVPALTLLDFQVQSGDKLAWVAA